MTIIQCKHFSNFSRGSRQGQLTARLPGQDFRNSMSNRNARLLNLLLRKTSSDAYFERRLKFPAYVLAVCAVGDGHAFEAGYEDTVGESLGCVSFD